MSYAIAYFCRQLKLYLLHKKCPMQLLKIANDHFAIIYEDKMFIRMATGKFGKLFFP